MSTVEPFHLNPKRVYNSPFTNYHLRLTITSMDHAWIRHLSGEKIKQRSKRLKALAIYIDVPSLKLLLDSILSDDLAFLKHLKYSRIECWTDSLESSRIEDHWSTAYCEKVGNYSLFGPTKRKPSLKGHSPSTYKGRRLSDQGTLWISVPFNLDLSGLLFPRKPSGFSTVKSFCMLSITISG